MSKRSIRTRQSHLKTIIGIDPGIRSIGYGVITSDERGQLAMVEAGMLLDPKRSTLSYSEIASALEKLISKWKPQIVGIERIYFAKNARSAFGVGETIGLTKLAAERLGIKWHEVSPIEVKLALTGSGRAAKPEVAKMADVLLGSHGLESVPHHASDALAVAITVERIWSSRIRQTVD